jgi:hypothetical protein
VLEWDLAIPDEHKLVEGFRRYVLGSVNRKVS